MTRNHSHMHKKGPIHEGPGYRSYGWHGKPMKNTTGNLPMNGDYPAQFEAKNPLRPGLEYSNKGRSS